MYIAILATTFTLHINIKYFYAQLFFIQTNHVLIDGYTYRNVASEKLHNVSTSAGMQHQP